MTSQDRAEQVRDELQAAVAAVAEQQRVSARLARAQASEAQAQQVVVEARRALADEAQDVQTLESFSPARIWATLRGRRDTDLDRERAEQQAAEYAVARAEALMLAAHDEVRRSEAELAALGDVAGRRERALAAMDEVLRTSGGAAGARLEQYATDLADAQAEQAEVREAVAAAASAGQALAAAQQALGSAGGWATYDTFFGGGLLTDMMKYDRMDDSQRALHLADAALRRLARELADVGIRGSVERLDVDGLTRTFDVWFDNIFSDWSVKSRISEAAARTDEAARAVHELSLRLAGRERELLDRVAQLAAERERLLMS